VLQVPTERRVGLVALEHPVGRCLEQKGALDPCWVQLGPVEQHPELVEALTLVHWEPLVLWAPQGAAAHQAQ